MPGPGAVPAEPPARALVGALYARVRAVHGSLAVMAAARLRAKRPCIVLQIASDSHKYAAFNQCPGRGRLPVRLRAVMVLPGRVRTHWAPRFGRNMPGRRVRPAGMAWLCGGGAFAVQR